MTASAVEPSPLTLRTDDGVTLSAQRMMPTASGETATTPVSASLSRAAPGDTAVVIVHGFGASKADPAVVALAVSLVARGHPVLVYDGRGHGQSDGACTLGDGERMDVDAAVAMARADAQRVVVVGASMGGIAVLNHLAPGGLAAGGVVVSTPARWQVPRTARGVLSVALTQTAVGRAFAARRIGAVVARGARRGAPPVEQIATIRHPIAIVHGTADRFIPASAAQVLHDAARPPRRIDIVAGMGHGYSAAATRAICTGVEWVMEQAMPGAAARDGDGDRDVETGPAGS